MLCSCEYRNVVDYTATSSSLMIIANVPTTTVAKAMKYIFITHQVSFASLARYDLLTIMNVCSLHLFDRLLKCIRPCKSPSCYETIPRQCSTLTRSTAPV